MKQLKVKILSFLVILCLVLPTIFVSTSAATINPATPTGYQSAQDVNYVKDGKYVANWGARGEEVEFLSTYATNFYTGAYVFDTLSQYEGGTGKSDAHKSDLYTALKNLMVSKQTYQTSYAATRDLYRYTDCVHSDYSQISSFYSGKMFDGTWDSGATWNREHVWPNSKGDLAGNGENDIMMLRPTLSSENGSRGNKAYGTSSGYYNPNNESGGKYDLRGDVSRVILYQYVRWGCINTGSYNPTDIYGTGGLIESLDMLLDWMEQDPVDTWEMGRNDAVQSITGTRNVFVDYPEYAWLLFGVNVPEDMTTPSGEADDIPDNPNRPDTPVTPDEPEEPEVPTYVVADAVAEGVTYKYGLVQPNKSSDSVYYINGGMASTYYLDTVTEPDNALDIYLEATNGGYYLCTTISGAKTYINAVVSGTHVNGVYESTASTVYTFDSDRKILVTTIDGTEYSIGTRNDKAYTTVGPVKTSYNGFHCQLYVLNTPTEPETPQGPDCENGNHDYNKGYCTGCGIYEVTEPTLVKEANGKWYFYKDGYKLLKTTLIKYSGKWFYLEDGEWDSTVTTLVKYEGKWFWVRNGKWDSSYTNKLVDYSGKKFYIKNGKWDSSINGRIKIDSTYYLIKSGKWSKTTEIYKSGSTYYYFKSGKWSKTTGLVTIDGTKYYVKSGKWTKTTTIYKKSDKSYFIKNGVLYTKKAIVSCGGKKYYVNKGYVQTTFSGKIKSGSKTYKIKKGVVV